MRWQAIALQDTLPFVDARAVSDPSVSHRAASERLETVVVQAVPEVDVQPRDVRPDAGRRT